MTMTLSDIRGKKVKDVAALIDPAKAQTAVLRAMAVLGSSDSWGGDELTAISVILVLLQAGTDFPSIADQDNDAIRFWEAIP